MEQKRKTIEWHPAFTASLQIEFEDEADKIIFESEHLLSKKPMQIDELVIKVHDNEKIQKNIGSKSFKHINCSKRSMIGILLVRTIMTLLKN